jgi:hypothetical protein
VTVVILAVNRYWYDIVSDRAIALEFAVFLTATL